MIGLALVTLDDQRGRYDLVGGRKGFQVAGDDGGLFPGPFPATLAGATRIITTARRPLALAMACRIGLGESGCLRFVGG